MFSSTPLDRRNRQVEWLFRALFLLMTIVLILPVVVILPVLIYKGGPAISFEFLFTPPKNGMVAGGVLPALVGTVWLVAVVAQAVSLSRSRI